MVKKAGSVVGMDCAEADVWVGTYCSTLSDVGAVMLYFSEQLAFGAAKCGRGSAARRRTTCMGEIWGLCYYDQRLARFSSDFSVTFGSE